VNLVTDFKLVIGNVIRDVSLRVSDSDDWPGSRPESALVKPVSNHHSLPPIPLLRTKK
jgi:hypothetical protein